MAVGVQMDVLPPNVAQKDLAVACPDNAEPLPRPIGWQCVCLHGIGCERIAIASEEFPAAVEGDIPITSARCTSLYWISFYITLHYMR